MGLRSLIPKPWRSAHKADSSTTLAHSPRSGPIHLDTSPGPSSSSQTGSLRGSPERFRRDSYLGRVQEEPDDEPTDDEGHEEDVDWELEQMGIYRGSYARLVAMYTLVPLASAVLLLLIAFVPQVIWPLPESTQYPSPPHFPSPLSELLLSIALWSLSHTIHLPIYTLFATLVSSTDAASLLVTVTHVILTNLLRLSAPVILRIRHDMDWPLPTWQDPAFLRVIWLAVGWSAAEVVVGVWQGYEMIALYKDALVPEGREAELLSAAEERVSSPVEINGSGFLDTMSLIAQRPKVALGIDAQVEQDLDRLLAIKAREEVEEVYGMPAIVSPACFCIHRANTIMVAENTCVHIDSAAGQLHLSLSWAWAIALRSVSFLLCVLSR